jgi:hypothetical protein
MQWIVELESTDANWEGLMPVFRSMLDVRSGTFDVRIFFSAARGLARANGEIARKNAGSPTPPDPLSRKRQENNWICDPC